MGKCSYRPKNPFRTALALWRVVKDSEDAGANIEEAAIVLFAFNRSRWGRKIARWDLLAQEVGQSSAEAKQLMQNRVRLPEVDLQALAALPIGSVGRKFAAVAAERDIDPNLVEKMPAETDADWDATSMPIIMSTAAPAGADEELLLRLALVPESVSAG